MTEGQAMNIGDAARLSGLPAKTIRYYEEIGLVRPLRGANGYRAFRERDLHKLTFVARARALGFSVEDCRGLLALYEDENRSNADVKEIAAAHLREIDDKIAQLSAMRRTLAHLVRACAGDGRPDCPILEDLGAGRDSAGVALAEGAGASGGSI
jgi:Cu(I)-responsive transcriptional regulator